MGLFFTPLPLSFYVCLVGEKRCREMSIIFGSQHNLQSCEYFVSNLDFFVGEKATDMSSFVRDPFRQRRNVTFVFLGRLQYCN